jgi:hypothetical protein
MEEKKKYPKRGRRNRLRDKSKKLRREDIVISPQIKELWRGYRTQYDPFMTDALIPRARHEWTSYKKIYATYETYCKAIGQDIMIPRKSLGILLAEHFCRRVRGDVQFALIVRDDLFVREANEVVIQED